MSLHLKQLDRRTRALMLEEIDEAETVGSLHMSELLSVHGKINYATLFKHAVKNGNDETFAQALVARESFKGHEIRVVEDKTLWIEINPHVAASNLAEAEFNRYYVRAICKRALQDGISTVTLYDANEKNGSSAEFETLMNKAIDAAALLRDLKGGAALHSNLKPNQSLSVKIEYHLH
jgi:hypothetical protein